MKKCIALLLAFAWLSIIPANVVGAEFQWMKDLNAEAEQNLAQFGKALGDRFGIAKEKVMDIMSRTETAADAYMSLKLGEMSGKSADEVIKKVQNGKQKGWGALAKSLGIKPGSKEFHELKSGHDLYTSKAKKTDDRDEDKGHGGEKGKGKSKKGKG